MYALEIQIATEQRNNKRLKQLYTRALGVKSAIPHPRVMGIIRECGGKMHMHERVWTDAATDFFEVRLCPFALGPSSLLTCLPPFIVIRAPRGAQRATRTVSCDLPTSRLLSKPQI